MQISVILKQLEQILQDIGAAAARNHLTELGQKELLAVAVATGRAANAQQRKPTAEPSALPLPATDLSQHLLADIRLTRDLPESERTPTPLSRWIVAHLQATSALLSSTPTPPENPPHDQPPEKPQWLRSDQRAIRLRTLQTLANSVVLARAAGQGEEDEHKERERLQSILALPDNHSEDAWSWWFGLLEQAVESHPRLAELSLRQLAPHFSNCPPEYRLRLLALRLHAQRYRTHRAHLTDLLPAAVEPEISADYGRFCSALAVLAIEIKSRALARLLMARAARLFALSGEHHETLHALTDWVELGADVHDNRKCAAFASALRSPAIHLGDPAIEARVEAARCWISGKTGNPEASLTRAYKLFEALANHLGMGWILHLKGTRNYAVLERPGAECREFFQAAIRHFRTAGATRALIGVCHSYSAILSNMGAHSEARRATQTTLRLAEDLGEIEISAYQFSQLGGIFAVTGEFDAARKFLTRASALHQQIGNLRGQSAALNNIGLLQVYVGNTNQARATYEAVLKLNRKLQDSEGIALTLTHLSILHAQAGSVHRARELSREAWVHAVKSGLAKSKAHTLSMLAEHERACGDLQSAHAHMKQAIALFSANDEPRQASSAMRAFAKILADQGKSEEATAAFENAIRLAEQHSDRHLRAEILQSAAIHHFDLHQRGTSGTKPGAAEGKALAQAEKLSARALQHRRALGEHLDLGRILLIHATIRAAQDPADPEQRAAIRRDFDEGLDCLFSHITRLHGARARRLIGDRLQRWIDAALVFYLDDPATSIDKLFLRFEQTRSRVLLDHLTASAQGPRQPLEPGPLAQEVRQRASELEELESRLAQARAAVPPAPELVGALQSRVATARHQFADTLTAAETRHPYYARIAGIGKPGDLAHFQRRCLAPGDTLLLFRVVGRRMTLLVVTPHSAWRHPLAWSAAEIEERVEAVLRHMQPDPLLRETYEPTESAWPLYQKLIAPVLEREPATRRLLIAPDGALSRFPFALLPTAPTDPWENGFENCSYLFDRVEIIYSESAAALDPELAPATPASKADFSYFGLGGALSAAAAGAPPATAADMRGVAIAPLPEATAEITDAASNLPGAQVCVGREATWANYCRLAPRAEFIHLATHAWINHDLPERSAIAFAAPASTTPGSEPAAEALAAGSIDRVAAHRIAQVPLRARLVLLNACATARGPHSHIEGELALARSFRVAGAGSVLATLWPVNDRSAALFARTFFAELARTPDHSLSTILRRTRIRFLRGSAAGAPSSLCHPYDWAAFILVGNPGTARNSIDLRE